jgi:hypothetical protein
MSGRPDWAASSMVDKIKKRSKKLHLIGYIILNENRENPGALSLTAVNKWPLFTASLEAR